MSACAHMRTRVCVCTHTHMHISIPLCVCESICILCAVYCFCSLLHRVGKCITIVVILVTVVVFVLHYIVCNRKSMHDPCVTDCAAQCRLCTVAT